MSAFLPFSPAMTAGTVGLTAAVVMTAGSPTAGSATIALSQNTNALLVVNASTLVAFVRVATVSGLTATASDVPIQPYSGGGGRLLAAPANQSVYVYAIPQATLAVAGTVYFCPGEGGIE